MEFITFNELSFKPLAQHSEVLKEYFLELCKTVEELRRKYPNLRVQFTEECFTYEAITGGTLIEWLEGLSNGGTKNTILSIISKPYLSDKDIEPLVGYSFENQQFGIEENYCWGLAFAKINDTVTISLATIDLWKSIELIFNRLDEITGNTEALQVLNVSNIESLENQTILAFLEAISEVELQETDLAPADKKEHLSGTHHGKAELKAFWDKIKNSPYVVALVCSLENHQGIKLIKKEHNDGKIELTLYWEDSGYSMMIQTTGRNLKETKEIAQILRKKYDK